MKKSVRFTLFAGALAAAAACAPGGDITSPMSASSRTTADLVGDRNDFYEILPGVVNACVFFTPYAPGVSATLSASAPAGEDVLSGNFSITPLPHCIEIWNSTDSDLVTVSSSLVSAPGWKIERIFRGVGVAGIGEFEWIYGQTSASVQVSDAVGGVIWFKMIPADVPPPPQGGQGCTPGYWRQTQHFDSWTSPYSPTTLFNSVFAGGFPGKTLLEVVWMGGGGINALGRHSVAALLNAASAGVSYDFSVAQAIARYNAAYLGTKSQQNDAKNVFEMLNQQGCPLN